MSRGVFEKVPGSGVWWARYTDSTGRLRREKAPGGMKSMAIQLYRKRKLEAEQGKKLPENLRQASVSFAEIADDCLAAARHIGNRSVDTQVSQLAVLKEWFGTRAADSITTLEIDAKLKAGQKEKGWSAKTFNDYRGHLLKIYRLAIRKGKVATSPVENADRLRVNNKRSRQLSAEEEAALREVIRKHYPWREPELDFALHTGVRMSNMYGLTRPSANMEPLQWKDVNLPFRVMTLPRTKTGVAWVLPLNDVALAALKAWRTQSDGTGAVIRNQDGTASHGPQRWFRAAIRKAGIEDLHWHDLRRTFRSRLRANGVSYEDGEYLLSHALPGVSGRYSLEHMPSLHAAVATLCKPKATDTATDTGAVVEMKAKVVNG
jgi:integrase